MLLPNASYTTCPECDKELGLTTAMTLQASSLGVSCECRHCGHQWIVRYSPERSPQESEILPDRRPFVHARQGVARGTVPDI